MTALKVLARPEEDEEANPRPVPWRRMAWVTWRQHRFALAGLGTLLSVLAAYVWVVGLQLHHAYAAAAACHPASSAACGELVGIFNGKESFLANGLVLQAVPALVGAFVGAPVLARELETGTFRFAWTQAFGPWRWALAKLVALGVAVAASAGALSLLFAWYYQPYFAGGNEALGAIERSPLDPGLFDLRGFTFSAWTLAAFAIGVVAGVVVRRVVPAIVATLVVYGGLALAAGLYLRHHYMAPLITTRLNVPRSAWIVGQQWLTKGGQSVSQSALANVLQGAPPQFAGKGQSVPDSVGSWQYLVDHGYNLWTSYQPASRFWPFQWTESGGLLALSVGLLAVTVRLVSCRAARR